MFEDYTYDTLLQEMLSYVNTDIDKREGSIIFDTLSPAALELTNAYIGLDIILSNAFAETAERDYLIKIASERGLSPTSATNAILKLEVTYAGNSETISEGDRFNLGKLNYVVTEQMVNESTDTITTYPFADGNPEDNGPKNKIAGWWKVKCETTGTEGNKQFGNVTPIESIDSLKSAKITEVLVYGEDEEDTEVFRQRYFDSINSDTFGGNKADYVKWVKAIDGVGQVKVERTPDGGGTVGIIITTPENGTASPTLIANVKKQLDPEEYTGLGEGIAPIGHSVTVESVKYSDWNIYFYDVEYEDDLTSDEVSNIFQELLDEYAEEINSTWEDNGDRKIYAMQLAAKCINADGIINIGSCKIGESKSDYATLSSSRMLNLYANIEE